MNDRHLEMKLFEKIKMMKEYSYNLKFADFGTRRRFSSEWHEYVVKTLSIHLPNNFVGTSNVYFAMKYNLKPIGTMARQ